MSPKSCYPLGRTRRSKDNTIMDRTHMLEIDLPETDLDTLLKEIDSEIRRKKRIKFVPPEVPPLLVSPVMVEPLAVRAGRACLRLARSVGLYSLLKPLATIIKPILTGDRSTLHAVELRDLLACSDEDFVTASFQILCGRNPDDSEQHHYLGALRNGSLSKVLIIGMLRYRSVDGRSRRCSVRGLSLPLAVNLAYRIPLLGNLLRLLVILVQLPRLQQQVEQRIARIEDSVVRKADRLLERDLEALWEVKGREGMDGFARPPSRLIQKLEQPSACENRQYYFEHCFRANPNVARFRQRVYLDHVNKELASQYPFLDVRCGTGEFLELLRESEIAAVGVDTREPVVSELKARGFEVFVGDAKAFLSENAGPYSGISAIQVIEHMTYDCLEEFIGAAFEKIVNGGIIILETANPHSLFALSNFYQDVTHIRPLPPEFMVCLLEWVGFRDVEIIFSSPVPQSAMLTLDKRVNYQEYALIGKRP
jgi:SAM-dependent methyltransferase